MPKRDDAPIGAPCWVDLLTTDPDRSRQFYGALFGWTVEDPGEDYGGYVNFLVGRASTSPGACATTAAPACPTCGPCTWRPTTPRRPSRAAVEHGGAGDGAADGRR